MIERQAERAQLIIEGPKELIGRDIRRDSSAAFSGNLHKLSLQPAKESDLHCDRTLLQSEVARKIKPDRLDFAVWHRLITAAGQTRSAKTVEVFGWLILLEGVFVLFAPNFSMAVLGIEPLAHQAANYFRLVGLLVCGLGMLYIASGRLSAEGFVFASMLDRPLVPFAMAILWHLGILPGALALIFSIQDFGSFLWTVTAWRAEHAAH